MNQTHSDYLSLLAYLLLRNGKPARAVRILKGLLVLEPENDWARRALAYAYLADEQHAECLAHMDDPDWPQPMRQQDQVMRIRSLWSLGQREEVREMIGQLQGNLRGEHGD